MKSSSFSLALAWLLAAAASAQPAQGPGNAPVGPPPGAIAIPIYGDANPGSPTDEVSTGLGGRDVRSVTYPTLTPVLTEPGSANGTAVIVAPGGGFMFLAMEHEGWQVARALADHGITAFVLKYRVNPTPEDEDAYRTELFELIRDLASGTGERRPFDDSDARQDARAALALVRSRSAEWQIDPHRVGMIGFSAGAIITLKTVLDAATDADTASRPPDFFGYVYGPMDAVPVPPDAPPMFVALAMDDPIFGRGDFSLVSAWYAAKRPVELHVYQTGQHGFGLGQPGTTSTRLMPQFLAWMDMQGLLKPKP